MLPLNLEQRVLSSLLQTIHKKLGWAKVHKIVDECRKATSKDGLTKSVLLKIKKASKQQQLSDVADVTWDDVGGLQVAKDEIIKTVQLPFLFPGAFDQWIRPRTGLLFFGPPGTGKTMLGKCIAKECRMGFISVKGPELLNMYVGQSEKNVRAVFDRAKNSRPCIIFMDELDALIPKRGQSNDSGKVTDRIVAELFTQMDEAMGNGVFVIGATNRPDLLDPAILRPGRFDKRIYLGIANDQEDRIKILKAQTRRLKLQPNIDLERIVKELPKNLTGADFYGLTSKVVVTAASKTLQQDPQAKELILTTEDFLSVASVIQPSVSLEDLRHYESLRAMYS